MASFDPDAYLASPSGKFDPDAYLANKETGGILKNFGAGAVSTITGIGPSMASMFSPLGNVADIVQWARGKGPAAATPLINKELTRLPNKLAGPANPDIVSRETLPEKLAFGAGAGVTGALIPGGEGFTVGNMLKNAALGITSGMGAVAGGEGAAALVPEQFKPAARAVGSVVGGVAGPVGAVGLVNGVRSGFKGIRDAAAAFTGAGPDQTVGKMLAEAAGGKVPATAEAPLPGMKPSLGQASGDQGLLHLERSVEQASPEAARLSAEARTVSNKAISDAIDQIGAAGGTPSETMLNRLDTAQKEAKRATSRLWKAAGVDESSVLPKDILQTRVDEYLGTLTTANRKNIPQDLLNTLKEIPVEKATLREIQDWRSNIGGEASTAFRAGQNVKGGVIADLQRVVADYLDEMPQMGGGLSGEQLSNYNAARRATSEMKQRFNERGSPVVTALSPKEFGAAAESNAANLFIKPRTSAGAPEAFSAYLKAVGKDPEAYQAVRDAFAQKFRAAIEGIPDASGQPTIKAAAVSKFMDNFDHIIQSDVFTPDQRKLLSSIDDAANMTARTARGGAPGGPDTFAKFSGKNWVDAMIGAGAKKVASVVGAAGGAALGGGNPYAAAVGAYSAPKVMETMLAANKEATMKLLTQAIYDPDLAKTLMTPATKVSAAKIPLPMQARIFSILMGREKSNDNAARKVSP
jgi:hypothetical protein